MNKSNENKSKERGIAFAYAFAAVKYVIRSGTRFNEKNNKPTADIQYNILSSVKPCVTVC